MIFGIICEFNPFHAGHKHLIDSIKGENDCVICAMSGNFVQRGDSAVYSKFDRAQIAIFNGADLVFEIPTATSTLSAQGFAQSGVKILESTGVCQTLAFGAECADTDALKALANEIKEKDKEIKEALKEGLSYPAARQKAVNSPLLETPNNILAIEYLSCTKLDAVAVKRIGKGHDSDDAVYSASEIRKTLDKEKTATLKNAEAAVLYKLRTMTKEDFLNIDDVSEGLENRIFEAVKSAKSLDELYDSIKTKRYTYSRIKRIILRAFLDITKDVPKEPQYLRILAMNEKGATLLGEIKKRSAIPIVASYQDAKKLGGEALSAFEKESGYTDIFNLCFKTPRPCGEDKTFKLTVLK